MPLECSAVTGALAPGSRFGPYDIAVKLGEGGMGAVYRARDTKLNRDVALKVLLPDVANDPERLARFRREAQTLAAVNHPHIGGIHGLEESAGVTALVMELVEGEDLSQRIARGPIPGRGGTAHREAGRPEDLEPPAVGLVIAFRATSARPRPMVPIGAGR